MPLGPLTIAAESGSVGENLRTALSLTTADGQADVVVTATAPTTEAHHVIITGPLTDEIDTWDTEVAPQTVAGALWLVPGQPDAPDAALAWLILRLQTPTTPLSDLTDNNGRALRWSVAAGTTVTFPGQDDVIIDTDGIRTWADAQPGVIELGEAVRRIGGDTAAAVLSSVQRLRAALESLAALGAGTAATPALDAAVADHLAQVQRSGFARWRGSKARAASQDALQSAAKDLAGMRLREVLDAREQDVAAIARTASAEESLTGLRDSVVAAVESLHLPATPDFSAVPRSWSSTAPHPRRYVFVHEDHLDTLADLPVTVRAADIPEGRAVCAVVQSGFSLPAIR